MAPQPAFLHRKQEKRAYVHDSTPYEVPAQATTFEPTSYRGSEGKGPSHDSRGTICSMFEPCTALGVAPRIHLARACAQSDSPRNLAAYECLRLHPLPLVKDHHKHIMSFSGVLKIHLLGQILTFIVGTQGVSLLANLVNILRESSTHFILERCPLWLYSLAEVSFRCRRGRSLGTHPAWLPCVSTTGYSQCYPACSRCFFSFFHF